MGISTHLVAAMNDQAITKVMTSKAKTPAHRAEKEETVREHCGSSRGGFKPKREVLSKIFVP